MRVLAALGAAVLFAATQLASSAAPASSHTLLAISSSGPSRSLRHVDALTLAAVDDRSVTLGPASGPFVRSPDKSLLAVSFGNVLSFIDTVQMEKLGTLQVHSAKQVVPVAWTMPNRLFALGPYAFGNALLVIDPIAESLVARITVPGGISSVVPFGDRIAYLAWSYSAIRSARVVVVDPDGKSHPVAVDRIRVGLRWHRVHGVEVADIREPGFAVDAATGTAYLIGASGLVAQIDLASLAVTYHSFAPSSTRRLALVEKAMNGPMRYARWLGDGKIAIAGTNAQTKVLGNKSVRVTWTPAGVAVVDTRVWQSRMIDPAANGFVVGGDALVISSGNVVKAYEVGGSLRFSVKIPDKLLYVVAFGGYAYAWGQHGATIVDLTSGTIVGAVPDPHLNLLGADD